MDSKQSSNSAAPAEPLVLAVLEDLFFGVKISEAAKRAGGRAIFTKTEESFWRRMEEIPALVVMDLTCRAMDPLALLAEIRRQERFTSVPTLGFLPHVQEDLKRQALAAGCQRVLPRSAFSSQVDALVAEALAATRNI